MTSDIALRRRRPPRGVCVIVPTACAVLLSMLVACGPQPAPPPPTLRKVATAAAQLPEGENRARSAGANLIGTPAPRLTLRTLEGETIDLAALYGKRPVYLKFWATWCVPCREQMPKFERIFETHGAKIAVIAVNTGFADDAGRIAAFRHEQNLRMPIVIDDGRLAKALNLKVTPQHVVIDRTGRIAFIGNLDGKDLDAALARVEAPGEAARPPAPRARNGDGTSGVPLRVGERVGRLTGTLVNGHRLPLIPGRRPTAIVFFSTWCEAYLAKSRPDSAQACRTARLVADRLAQQNQSLTWIGVAGGPWSTEREDLAHYRRDMRPKITLALDSDGTIFRAFGVHDIPTIVLVAANGKVAQVIGPGGDIEGSVRRFEESLGTR